MSKTRIRFSLLILLVVTTACALYLAYKATKSNRISEFERKADAIGGVIIHEHQIVDGRVDMQAHLAVPAVIRDAVDDGWFVNPQVLYLECKPVTDDDLAFLKDFDDIRFIHLAFTKISDRALKYVSEVSQLETLLLYNTEITDEGISELRKLKNLQCLDIRSTLVSDESWKFLTELPLKGLYVSGTRMTKEGVNSFRLANPECTVEFNE